jgi:universal stress protein A
MKPFKKILVPVDFAPHSHEAIEAAADLARRYSASLTLLHVYEPVTYILPEGYVLFTPEQLNTITTELQRRLDKAASQARSAGASEVATRLVQGSPSGEIVATQQSDGYDLIVMGTHGRTGIGHVLLGSVAEKVVRGAHCPVLTVRAPDAK